MRSLVAALVLILGTGAGSSAQNTCTGLCLQQLPVNSCANGGTTSISGVVYAPNGVDPLPNVTVYVPNAPVPAFQSGVSCPVVGAPQAGAPLVGTTTAVDGSFTISNMPVGTNIPLVIVSGRWRRQLVIPTVTSCRNTALPSTPGVTTAFVRFPANQFEGDIPKIAIATGSVDAVECVLRKVGINDGEFTDPTGTGRINFYVGDGAGTGGAAVSTATPAETTLMNNSSALNQYDVLMLPCEGSAGTRPAAELANLINFADSGGRVYASHFAYEWMYKNTPFNTVANWTNNSLTLADGPATVNTNFSGGQTLSTWLEDVGASATNPGQPAQITVTTNRNVINGVNPPTESWLTLNAGGATMQFVFDTPVITTSNPTPNQCGRVLFNQYHVEAVGSSFGQKFPTECATTGTTMSPQEKLLEYSLFELTNNGGTSTLTPTSQNFGTVAVGFSSPVQTFTWTNLSTFTASVTTLNASGDFSVTGSNCTGVQGGNSCTISVVYSPTTIGAGTGTLTVGSNGTTLTSSLTGTGVPALTLSPGSLSFGSLDVGASLTQTLTLQNTAPGALPIPTIVTTGDYIASTAACGSSVAANSTCAITVTFKPTTTGSRPGTLTIQSSGAGSPTTLAGNGIDFTFADAPASGTVVAGLSVSSVATTTPIAGFANPLTLTCTTNAPSSKCTLASTAFTPTSTTTTAVTITTTSQYTVIGYGAVGGGGYLSLFGVAGGLLLWFRRRSVAPRLRSALTIALLAIVLGAASVGLSGCSGLLPAKNASYTPAGAYTYTITATDGFLVHSTAYSLTVTAQ